MRSILAEELERLRDDDGLLRPERVVDAAANAASPLHEHFEWNDSKAAHAFRIDQARHLIRQIKIPFRINAVVVPVPAYVPSVTTRNAYERINEVEPGSNKAHAIVMDELARVAGILGRARKVATVLHAEDEIDELLEALASTRAKLETRETA